MMNTWGYEYPDAVTFPTWTHAGVPSLDSIAELAEESRTTTYPVHLD